VTESAPSTVAADAVSFTLTGLEWPPQPLNVIKRANEKKAETMNSQENLR
jgi:hypothetical protein